MPHVPYLTFRMTVIEAMQWGLLTCTCGHPPNNHFGDRAGSCARCDCVKYREVARVGTLVKGK